ncbi:hypothetical protein ABEB36_002371 [Hypothenemus hampei]|uniref:Beta-glucosidase n=1 Tax=Hypothenemus hampei TaxID=57062 RepID=A0ABD1F5J7_HYPHA
MVMKLCLLFFILASSQAARYIPKNLWFGTATASYQIEGAWNESGKGENIWDKFLHDANRDQNGDVTCDSYHKWQEDIENLKKLNVNHYRFSISWPRILPDGTLKSINQEGIDYYYNLIQGLIEAGIEPMVTLYHWDMPVHISELGGFLNPQFIDYFEDYARLVYQEYGPYVRYWLTFNEPYSICNGGYGAGQTAPGLNLIGDGIYQCSYVLLKAHARGYRIYDEEFRPKYNGKVGIVLNINWFEPASNTTADSDARERLLQFQLGWWANPVFNGNWPQIMIDRIANRSSREGFARSRLPQFTQEEIDYINGTHDFFALNTYKTYVAENTEYNITDPSYWFDVGVTWTNLTYYPEGFRKLINFVNDRYRPESIIITENGLQTTDYLNDTDRITYIKGYINSLLDAIEEDKINVFGYTVWSLMDNFEWGSYDSRFGLINVNFTDSNRTRTWKDSGYWFKNILETRILDV